MYANPGGLLEANTVIILIYVNKIFMGCSAIIGAMGLGLITYMWYGMMWVT